MLTGLPEAGIFGAGLVERYSFGWRLTARGLKALEEMEHEAAVRFDVPSRSGKTEDFAGLEENRLITSPPGASSSDLADARRAQFSVIKGALSRLIRTIPPEAA